MPPRPRLFDDHLNTKAGPHAAPLTPTFANMPPRWDANVGVGPLASGFAHAQSDGWRRWALGAVGSAPGRAEHRYQRLVRIAAQCIIGLNDANIGATALALVSLFAPISCFALVAFLALITPVALVSFGSSHPLRSLRTGSTGGALRACRTLRSLLTFRTWIAATRRQCKRNPQNQYWNEFSWPPLSTKFSRGADAKPVHVGPSPDIAAPNALERPQHSAAASPDHRLADILLPLRARVVRVSAAPSQP